MNILAIAGALSLAIHLSSASPAQAAHANSESLVSAASAAEIDGGAAVAAQARARGRTVRANRSVNVNRRVVRNRNVNVNVNRTVVRRPVAAVRPWRPRPHYGTFVAGVALGTIVTAAVVGTAPAAPASNVCWYWSDSNMTQGYWDYCR
jgi:hypothetical protein